MDEINKIWPKYYTEELIGAGSFGKVYRVRREELGKTTYAAVKVIHIPQSQSEVNELRNSGMDFNSIRSFYQESVENLMNEITLMDSLKSGSNVVSIEDYEVREKEEGIGWDIYIRMELLTNCNDYIAKHGNKMSESLAIKLGMDICKALQNCEKRNIIHRDIKLDNVFVSPFGDFKLGDFGISKQLEKTKSAMSQKGTSMYMAPEVYRGEKYDKTVDIYSLGILLYRLLNHGRFPFVPGYPLDIRPNDLEEAMIKRMSGAMFDYPDGASIPVAKVILKACAYKAEDRYQSATEMLTDLESCVSSAGTKQASIDDGMVESINLIDDEETVVLNTSEYERTASVFGTKDEHSSQNAEPRDESVSSSYRVKYERGARVDYVSSGAKTNKKSKEQYKTYQQDDVEFQPEDIYYDATIKNANKKKSAVVKDPTLKWYKFILNFELPWLVFIAILNAVLYATGQIYNIQSAQSIAAEMVYYGVCVVKVIK